MACSLCETPNPGRPVQVDETLLRVGVMVGEDERQLLLAELDACELRFDEVVPTMCTALGRVIAQLKGAAWCPLCGKKGQLDTKGATAPGTRRYRCASKHCMVETVTMSLDEFGVAREVQSVLEREPVGAP